MSAMKNKRNHNIYEEYGYRGRREYLHLLADDYGVPYSIVADLSSVLGADEDFDALVTEIEDYADMMMFEEEEC